LFVGRLSLETGNGVEIFARVTSCKNKVTVLFIKVKNILIGNTL